MSIERIMYRPYTYPQSHSQAFDPPPQSPTKKDGLLNKLGRGLAQVATSENLEKGIRGLASGIERAAKSDFVANVGKNVRTGLSNYEAQLAAARAQQQEVKNAQYQQPATAPETTPAEQAPEESTSFATSSDTTALYSDIPPINASLYSTPSTLAFALQTRCRLLEARFHSLKAQGYTDTQLQPLFNEFCATFELWRQANAVQEQYQVNAMMRPGGFGWSIQNQLHQGNMEGIAALGAGTSAVQSGSYYGSGTYYSSNTYW
jgi:hypothetical protein